ncbi:MAG: type II secretion system secretin GspD [Kiritimatiellales bacterium]
MKLKTLIIALLTVAALPVFSQQKIQLSFEDAPLDQAVELYREWTGRTILKQADLSARITLKGRDLTQDEAKQAIETVLAMNGVALVPMGDKFLKVVPIANARQEGMEIRTFDPEDNTYVPADVLMSQVIPLRYVLFQDVQPLIQHLIHAYGKIQHLERINSVLVTDTAVNIAKIVELITMVDQPLERIEPRIYQLNYAEAGSVASKLKELVDAAKTKTSEQQGSTVAVPAAPPGVIRAPRAEIPASTPSGSVVIEQEMIQGEVKFVSDERTNILIVFSKEANFEFFDRIIKVLDVPVDPTVTVEVINLEYAKAKEIAGILNEFVGAAQVTEKTKAPGAARTPEERREAISDVAANITRATGTTVSPEAQNAIGRLSADTKILSDERSNSLLLMGRKSDIATLKVVVASLDVMLEQVMIEAVILSINLGDTFQTGVQWVYDHGGESLKTTTTTSSSTGTGITTVVTNMIKEATEYSSSHTAGFDASGLASNLYMSAGSLSYYGIIPSLDLRMIINAAKTDSDARILSTPVVMTTDNTEAKITIGEERPVISSSINSYNDSYSARATYEYRNIGITLTVTPNINPKGFVVMEITQTADDVAGEVTIDKNEVPIVAKREISATVAVQDRATVMLGGLIRKEMSKSNTKIPLLGDIPLLGWLFSSRSNKDNRSELVVLLTPYVMTNPEQVYAESRRRFDSSDSVNTQWPRGWSESSFANDEPEKEKDEPGQRKGWYKRDTGTNNTASAASEK